MNVHFPSRVWSLSQVGSPSWHRMRVLAAAAVTGVSTTTSGTTAATAASRTRRRCLAMTLVYTPPKPAEKALLLASVRQLFCVSPFY